MQERFEDGVLILAPTGDLEEPDCARTEASASERKARAVLLDLSASDYLSSQGIGILLALQARLAPLPCSLLLAAPTPLLRRLLHQAGLASILPLHASVEAALASAR